MTTKEYLSQLNRLDTIIKQKQAQLDELKELVGNINSTDYSREIVASSKDNNANYVKEVEKIALLEGELNRIIEEYLDKKDTIINQIHALDNANYIKILYMRYVENKSFVDISKDLNYEYGYTKKLNKLALLNLEKTLKDTEKPFAYVI